MGIWFLQVSCSNCCIFPFRAYINESTQTDHAIRSRLLRRVKLGKTRIPLNTKTTSPSLGKGHA